MGISTLGQSTVDYQRVGFGFKMLGNDLKNTVTLQASLL
jgi:hypothetical protein